VPGPVAQRTERQPSKLRAVVRFHPGPLFYAATGAPNFRLFTWFFVVPGLLVALLALFGLYGDRIHFSLHHARPTAA
jgi:hypothetical protein